MGGEKAEDAFLKPSRDGTASDIEGLRMTLGQVV